MPVCRINELGFAANRGYSPFENFGGHCPLKTFTTLPLNIPFSKI